MATHSGILAGKFHGQWSLARYSPQCHKESETAEHTGTQSHTNQLFHGGFE